MAIDTTHEDDQRFFSPVVEEKLVGLLGRVGGVALFLLVSFLWLSLATWTIRDPSLTLATGGPVQNLAGAPGAILADLLLQMLGFASVVALFAPMIWSFELIKARQIVGFRHKGAFYPISVIMFAGALSALPASAGWPITYGYGGILGDFVFGLVSGVFGWINPSRAAEATGILLAALGVSALMRSLGLELRDLYRILFQPIRNVNWRSKADSWQNVLLTEAKRVRDTLSDRPSAEQHEEKPATSTQDAATLHHDPEGGADQARGRVQPTIVMPRQPAQAPPVKPATPARPNLSHAYAAQPQLRPVPHQPAAPQVAHRPAYRPPAAAPVGRVPVAPPRHAGPHPYHRPASGLPQHGAFAHHPAQQAAPRNHGPAHAVPTFANRPQNPSVAMPTRPATLPPNLAKAVQQVPPRPVVPPTAPHPVSNPFDGQERPSMPARSPSAVTAPPRTPVAAQPMPPSQPPRPQNTDGASIAEQFARHAEQMATAREVASPEPLDDDDAVQSRAIARRFAPQSVHQEEDETDPLPPVSVEAEPSTPVPAFMRGAKTQSARGRFVSPSTTLLARQEIQVGNSELSPEELQANAEQLQQILADFGVKGAIRNIHPGPVVTLYEFEPARGIKSSRVIGLADDIARSMSAVSARVAVVPGRNAIGIELPNAERTPVLLRALLESPAYRGSSATLPLTLGQSIGGDAVIADLARMPHLLVAGTTGSGKSVGVNAMVLSILFKHAPETCRLLMIDPKMLELSVYNDIPHLLSPVITDPQKAVVALNWAVREMEERYKRMSKLSVRNISVYNNRIRNARKRGEALSRTVHTGFDAQGQAIYEKQEMALEELPNIVIVVDEFADLMLVAGKEIEAAIQRLAQMARAAGIHLIMATQRPSVDVITGTIKANFPTRISFKVTSKVDSRTILNEQGAEQLLGQGDMLFAGGSGQTTRVHGPFVSDDEVEAIANYLKTQGVPDYVPAVTEEVNADASGAAPSAGQSNSDDLYDRAVALVVNDGKASTSYVQRRLSIGYNRAADLIERMEQAGVISPAGRGGKREILTSDAGRAATGAAEHAA